MQFLILEIHNFKPNLTFKIKNSNNYFETKFKLMLP